MFTFCLHSRGNTALSIFLLHFTQSENILTGSNISSSKNDSNYNISFIILLVEKGYTIK